MGILLRPSLSRRCAHSCSQVDTEGISFDWAARLLRVRPLVAMGRGTFPVSGDPFCSPDAANVFALNRSGAGKPAAAIILSKFARHSGVILLLGLLPRSPWPCSACSSVFTRQDRGGAPSSTTSSGTIVSTTEQRTQARSRRVVPHGRGEVRRAICSRIDRPCDAGGQSGAVASRGG